MPPLILATEDVLSEAIGLRILALFPDVPIRQPPIRRNGNGYLRSRLPAFCEIAGKGYVLLITDLDTRLCPATMISSWLGRSRPPSKLLFRVAVRQIESWLLADHVAMTSLLGQRLLPRLPEEPDLLPNAKDALLSLARRGPRDVRADLYPNKGVVAKQGFEYNTRLCKLVTQSWDPNRAATRSPSLRRTITRLHEALTT